jgi:putative ATP-dependent endonuclease of OLD family
MVLLKHDGTAVVGRSLAGLKLSEEELEDLQRYLHTTRADIFFSRGVIFVEGDAEESLIPTFASSLGIDLDLYGIAVCNVAGVNFTPYVKLAAALGLPYSVITDWDPLDGSKSPLGKKRALDINDAARVAVGGVPVEPEKRAIVEAYADDQFRTVVAKKSIFLNSSTLETEIALTPTLALPLIEVLEAENFGPTRSARLTAWKTGTPVNFEQLLAMIADVGKGRLSGRFALKAKGLPPPAYIENAIRSLIANV